MRVRSDQVQQPAQAPRPVLMGRRLAMSMPAVAAMPVTAPCLVPVPMAVIVPVIVPMAVIVPLIVPAARAGHLIHAIHPAR